MSAAPIYPAAPDFEERHGEPVAPRSLMIEFSDGVLTPSLRGCAFALDIWEEPACVTLAIMLRTGVAVHIDQSADDLRALGTACLSLADQRDGGKGKQ